MPAAALAFALLPSAAYAQWVEVTTAHFVLYSKSGEGEAKAYAEKLERFDGALRTLQGKEVGVDVGPANKVKVFRYGETGDIGGLAGSRGVAGFYIPRAGRPVAFVPRREDRERGSRHFEAKGPGDLDSTSVLMHEYMHHFMLQNFPAAYPGWYIEGFAELHATIDLKDDGSFHVGNVPNYRAYQLFQMNIMPVERLLDSKREKKGMDYMQHYSLGWLLSHYLSFEPKRDGQLRDYLKALAAGEESLTAAKRIFGDLTQLDKELKRYLKGDKLGIDVKPSDYQPPKVTVRHLTEVESAAMNNTIKLSRGVSRSEAKSIAAESQKRAAANPGSLQAQLVHTEALLDARQFVEALAAADRALTVDPKSVDALVFKARALIEPKEGPQTRFTDARRVLVEAHKLDETDPRPLIQFYMTWRRAGQAAPKAAMDSLELAWENAAFDADYRGLLALQLLEDKRGDAAKLILSPLAVQLHGVKEEKNIPALVIELIDKGDIEGARAKLASERDKAEEEAAKD